LRTEAAALAAQDAEAYTQVLAAYQLPRSPDAAGRRDRIRAALSAAAEPPLAVATAAVEIGTLARRLVDEGNPNLWGDAVTSRLLAAAGCRAAVELVGANLLPGDPRLERAKQLADSWDEPA
jgi:formiminotetrahydrofolate cyclodeaminase